MCCNRRIQEILPERVKQWKETPCVADQRAEGALDEVEKRKKVEEELCAPLHHKELENYKTQQQHTWIPYGTLDDDKTHPTK